MSVESIGNRPWWGRPVIALITRLRCQELTLENEYLRAENQILKSKIQGRIRFTDDVGMRGPGHSTEVLSAG